METRGRTVHRWWLAAAATGLVVGLGACGKSDDKPAAPGGTPATATAAPRAAAAKESGSAAERATAKMNAYTEGYNKLIGTFGLPETQERYVKENIGKRKPTDNLSISRGWVSIAQEQLKKGRALPATGLEEVDQRADRLLASLDALVTRLNGLDTYYQSKAYKEDNLARGKAEDPLMLAAFDDSIKAMRGFDEALSREARKRTALELERMKASGDLLGYNTKFELQRAEEIVALFGSAGDVRNAETYKKADPLIAELEKTLADQEKAYEAARQKQPSPDSGHESAARRLVSFVGAYRDMRQSKQTDDFNRMVKDYNSAIDSANRISR